MLIAAALFKERNLQEKTCVQSESLGLLSRFLSLNITDTSTIMHSGIASESVVVSTY